MTKKTLLSSHQQSPLMASIRTESQSSPDSPLSRSDDPPPLFRSSHPSRSEYVTIVDQAIPNVDSETEEEEEVSPWTSIRSFRDRTPEGVSSSSAVLDDVSCLENSLETVSTISAEMESLREAAHMSTIDFSESNPYLLTDSFFAGLRKDQAKAERLGLNGTLYNSLLIEVLKEHVRLVQTLSIHMSNRVISLVPTSLVKNPAVFKGSAVSNSLTSDAPLQTPSSISISFPVVSKKTHVGRTPETMDQDIVQSNVPFIRADQDQHAKVKEQIYMACQDLNMQEAEPLTPLSNQSKAKYQNNSQVDRIKADENSVWLAWHRWKVGDNGSLSLEELVKRMGLDRMASELQSYCLVAYHLSREIERLCAGGMMFDTAVQSLEARRYLTLSTLAMVLSQEWDRRCSREGLILSNTSAKQLPSRHVEKIDGAILSNPFYPSVEKTISRSVPSYDSMATATFASSHAPPVPAEKPIPRLPFASHTISTPSTSVPRSIDTGIGYGLPTKKVSITATAVGTFGSLLVTQKSSSSTNSPVESLRSTFEALAAMNTSTSTLGSAFTQRPTAIQPLPNTTRIKDLQIMPELLPSSLASSTLSITHPFTVNLSTADSIISPTSALFQEPSTLASHRSTRQSSRIHSEPASHLPSISYGLYNSVSHAPSATTTSAPSSHRLIPVTRDNIHTYFTVPFHPQQSPAPSPSQPQMLISPQHQVSSLSISQAPGSLISCTPRSSIENQSKAVLTAPFSAGVTAVQSLPTTPLSTAVITAQSNPTALHSAGVTTTQLAAISPGLSNSGSSQGVMQTINTAGSGSASLPSNAAVTSFNSVFQHASVVSHLPIPRSENHIIGCASIVPTTIPTVSTSSAHSAHIASSMEPSSPLSTIKQQETPSVTPVTLPSTATRTATVAETIAPEIAATTPVTTTTTTPATTITIIGAPSKALTSIPLLTQLTTISPQAPISAMTLQQAHGAPMLSTLTSSTALVKEPIGPQQPMSSSATTVVDRKEQIQFFRINYDLQTVFEIWDLWTVGIQGGPSVTDLIGKHKMGWLHPTDRETYRNYRSVLLTLERSVRLLKLDVRAGLAQLENVREEFKMSVQQFAKILTEVDIGKTTPSMVSTLGTLPSSSLLSSITPPKDHAAETIQAFAKAIAALTLSSPSSDIPSPHP